ncbi:MAG TPA: response regulator transcription factor [Candidatus Binataceae bacterium]|nr:response regulator transcription factor [Candidatus Binataceae bacterium]
MFSVKPVAADSASKCRVVIIDDHEMVVAGLSALLAMSGIKVIGCADSAEDGLKVVTALLPDVAIIDVQLPGASGINAAHSITRSCPNVKTVMLSGYDDREYVLESLLGARASAYVLKSDGPATLVEAVKAAIAEKRYISPSVAGCVLERLRPAYSKVSKGARLSRREREVIMMIAKGATAKQIAAGLAISAKTAQAHRSNVAAKLGLRSTASIVHYAIRAGLVPL